MVFAADVWILVGILGFVGSTFGTALLAWTLYRLTPKKGSSSPANHHYSIEILVAAHNEETLVVQTLTSLSKAASRILVPVKITLGLDHCNDSTEVRAREWAQRQTLPFQTIINPGPAGKWNMIQFLVKQSQAEWIALVDVGSVWNKNLLRAATHFLQDPDVLGVAPSYRPVKCGLLENLSWKLERALKAIESKAGGPISVHGASVLYRRSALLRALESLNGEFWLNDDVVIPLTLRTLFPRASLVYLCKENGDAWVNDHGIREIRNVEYGRRKRILVGNLQWMRVLFAKAFSSSFQVGIISSRRVFRAFWAYWLLFLIIGIFLRIFLFLQTPILGAALALVAITIGIKLPLQGSLERLRAAFYAGLELPLHWLNTQKTASEKIWH
ncbi:MAG: glycosyltransferase [Bdellovibrionales bacterium]|nr:glycosyltransferase [Oligoflexia bacterium]